MTLLRISQSHLSSLETCPRRFQNTYLEQLKSPVSLDQQERTLWGSQFHLLMQQRELGLSVEAITERDRDLQSSVEALIKAAPAIFASNSENEREAEHSRTLRLRNYLLTVIYDLLITKPQKAEIFDWKTYLIPTDSKKVAKTWQTRLYLYVLAETSTYSPEQISMTYWFVKLPNKPKSITFKYSQAQHEQTQQDLAELLICLDDWLEAYNESGYPFPKVSPTKGHCKDCNFALRCQRINSNQDKYSLAEIEEVII